MKETTKIVLKVLSNAYLKVQKHYKIYRTMFRAANPYIKYKYNIADCSIMAKGRSIPVRVFRPREYKSDRVLIFFHGGGWVAGDINSYTKVCANMAEQTAATVVSVNYRLAPENPFPAGLEDCFDATREIFLHPDLLFDRQEDICLIGDSAGGNLAAVVSLMARDSGEFLPSKQILLYPATYFDYSENSPFSSMRENGKDYILTAERIQNYLEMYVPDAKERRNPYVAPFLAPDLANQPKTLIITAEFDPLRDEGEAYGRRLKEFHNQVCCYRLENALHGFLTLPKKTKVVQKCYEVIHDFLQEEE